MSGLASYRERLRRRFYDPRLKWAWQVLAYGGLAVCVGALFTALPFFVLIALMTGHGSFGDKLIQAYLTYQTIWLFFLGATIAEAVLCVVAFRQLRRIASLAASKSPP